MCVQNSNEEKLINQKRIKKGRKLLLIGAGGIGIELIKCLKRMEIFLLKNNFSEITIIDNDFIEISNLNRQFIFQKEDINKNKSEISAKYLEKYFSNKIKVNFYVEKITKESRFDSNFLENYDVILNGLDNLVTRKYVINRIFLINKLRGKNILIIDGGTMGFQGQVRYFKNNCYECLNIKENQEVIPVCTIKGKPEKFEHSLIWALNRYEDILENNEKNFIQNKYTEGLLKEIENKDFNNLRNERQKLQLVYLLANYQCDEFGIQERKSFLETESSIKKIVPSVATINAIISSLMIKNFLSFYGNGSITNFFVSNSKILENNQIFENENCSFCKLKKICIKTVLKDGKFVIKSDEVEDLKDFLNLKKFTIYDFEDHLFFLNIKKKENIDINLEKDRIFLIQEGDEKYLMILEEIQDGESFDLKYF